MHARDNIKKQAGICKRCSKDESWRERRGCYPDFKRAQPERLTIGGTVVECWHCLRSVSAAVSHWFPHSARLSDSGVLPHAGGWDDQPARYCQAMDIIFSINASRLEEPLK